MYTEKSEKCVQPQNTNGYKRLLIVAEQYNCSGNMTDGSMAAAALLRLVYRSHLHLLLCLWAALVVCWCVSHWWQQQREEPLSRAPPPAAAVSSHYDLHPDDGRRSSPCLTATFESRAHIYLGALRHAVQIMPLPAALGAVHVTHCARLRAEGVRPDISAHTHALELHFPAVLREMSSSSSSSSSAAAAVDPLWRPGSVAEPLFYYVEALPYHVVYCTRKCDQKEDWSGRDAYWTRVAQHIVGNASFMKHMGKDYILPASHPQLGPGKIHPSSLSYLLRASFLKTDFDISGGFPKDVIIPYYVPLDTDNDTDTDTDGSWCRNVSGNRPARPRLLFFAGSDNPRGGYRSLFLHRLEQALGAVAGTTRGHRRVLDRGGVYVSLTQLAGPRSPWWSSWRPSTLDGNGNERWYTRQMQETRFCLVLRGDTTSSKRFFTAVASGCVPVVVSDGLRLPFADAGLVDYSTFALFFPESVVVAHGGIARMLAMLRAVPERTYRRMRCALGAARRYLLYRRTNANSMTLSELNPVTLALIELLVRREKQCSSSGAPRPESLCATLLGRLTSR